MTYKSFHSLFYLFYLILSLVILFTGILGLKQHERYSMTILIFGIVELFMTIFGFFRYRKPKPF